MSRLLPDNANFDDGPPAPVKIDGSRILAKAAVDDYVYLVGLRSGTMFLYERADVDGNWVTLHGARPANGAEYDSWCWGRPIEVRRDAIEWYGDKAS